MRHVLINTCDVSKINLNVKVLQKESMPYCSVFQLEEKILSKKDPTIIRIHFLDPLIDHLLDPRVF